MSTVPTFKGKATLVRYIDPNHRMSKRRISSTAFELPPDEAYLSVNSAEVEKVTAIARYYKALFDPTDGKVAVSQHQVAHYNLSAKSAGLAIHWHSESATWRYAHGPQQNEAYKHRPVRIAVRGLASPSHCGVEFLSALPQEKKFARRMCRQKYHLI